MQSVELCVAFRANAVRTILFTDATEATEAYNISLAFSSIRVSLALAFSSVNTKTVSDNAN